MTLERLVQATYTLPKPAPRQKVKAQAGGERASTQADWEASLAPVLDGRWVVLWKTASMGSVAFTYHDTLCAAWGHFLRHRDRVWALVHPSTDVRRAHVQRQIARLQAELEAL